MMGTKHLAVVLVVLCLCNLSIQTPPFYSLQPAVEALSEREAQLALRNEIENGNIDDFVDNDFEWNNDYDNSEREQHVQVPNKALAGYLARTNNDYEDFYPNDYRKRSMARKRDNSVFRERARAPQLQHQQQQALAEKFLRAIEDEREREEEEEYQQQLRNLWNRYQVEEGNMEKELFDNEIRESSPLTSDDVNREQRNRQNVGDLEVAPSYWTDKRSMPLLPWLPASRKKRFPVTKRSPKVNNDLMITQPETSEKVSRDLKGIFGVNENGVDDVVAKKKRSSNDADVTAVDNTKKEMKSLSTEHGTMQSHVMTKKRKRNAADPDDDEEVDNENVEEEADDADDSSEDESKKKKKKKREAPKSLKMNQEGKVADKKFNIRKKSVEWSKIFGIDRKKKSVGLIFHPLEDNDRRRKRCQSGDCEKEGDYDEEEYEDEDYRRKKKRSREEKLETMDHKLKSIENLIIEDTAKFYDNHDGSLNPSEARSLRNRVAERLATAYSLEKMRKAIARLKQSMALEKNLERNLLNGVSSDDEEDDKKKAKRVAVKKEKAEFENSDHDVDSPAKKASSEVKKNDLGEGNSDKKKKKRSQKKSELGNSINEQSPMSEGYMGGKTSSECPLLDGIEKRCRGIDIMEGDSHQNLLEACGAHQLCYLCGGSQLQCDYDYLTDADEVCGHDLKCAIAAREALSVLRSLGSTKLSQRECKRNPCLNMALRSISY